MRIRKALAVTALGAALTSGAVLLPATSAGAASSAVTCGNANWPHPDKDSGTGTITAGSAAVHTGPYGDCTVTAYLDKGMKVTYDCYSVNSAGNKWTYVRHPQGASIGWVYGKYLDDGGATKRC
ncbi:SH3 domain-containing protein [Streptomyces sclerotialus]|uniref:SH3 domain-containing protein n=1 Tax=Streptomyces sclerotialus TaxID=1957 RepID=UPI00068D6D08